MCGEGGRVCVEDLLCDSFLYMYYLKEIECLEGSIIMFVYENEKIGLLEYK